MGCQQPESMEIAQRTELFFYFVTQHYIAPFYVRTDTEDTAKVYDWIFSCLSTKAVYLELATNLPGAELLLTFPCFVNTGTVVQFVMHL